MGNLDGFNLEGQGGGGVTGNYIWTLDNVNNRIRSTSINSDLQLFDFVNQETIAPIAGEFRGLYVGIETNSQDDTCVFQFYKNGVAQGTGITFAAGETGKKKIIETIAFALGDLLEIRSTLNGVGSIDFNDFTVILNFDEVIL